MSAMANYRSTPGGVTDLHVFPRPDLPHARPGDTPRLLECKALLQVHPELGPDPEIGPQTQGHIGRHANLLQNQVSDPGLRDMQFLRQPIRTQAQGRINSCRRTSPGWMFGRRLVFTTIPDSLTRFERQVRNSARGQPSPVLAPRCEATQLRGPAAAAWPAPSFEASLH